MGTKHDACRYCRQIIATRKDGRLRKHSGCLGGGEYGVDGVKNNPPKVLVQALGFLGGAR